VNDLQQFGFPTRRDEDWKYTSVDGFAKHAFTASSPDTRVAKHHDLPISVMTMQTISKALALGAVIKPWRDAFLTHADKITPYLGKIASSSHAFLAQNMAMMRDGLFIYLPKGVCLDEPLLLSHWQDQMHHATYMRYLIVAEEGSRATIIEDYQGDMDVTYFTNTVTELHLEAHASIVHYKLQREGLLAYHVGEVAARQKQHSHFESHSLSLGGRWVRSDTNIALTQSKAHCVMNGVYATSGDQHIDHHTVVHHAAPGCRSEQDYKGMMAGYSRGVFNGRVVVAVDAQQTEAKQQNKNLLLSPHADINTKPQLEIFADDVVCSHGATVGQLDEEALFYLGTRGIPRTEAARYLVQAFVTENLKNMRSEPLTQWMGSLLHKHLG
jgi:Fe-S cluster assembly protein SufD